MESLFIWGANGAVYSSLFTHAGGQFKGFSLTLKCLSDKSRLEQMILRLTTTGSRLSPAGVTSHTEPR